MFLIRNHLKKMTYPPPTPHKIAGLVPRFETNNNLINKDKISDQQQF